MIVSGACKIASCKLMTRGVSYLVALQYAGVGRHAQRVIRSTLACELWYTLHRLQFVSCFPVSLGTTLVQKKITANKKKATNSGF